MMCAYLCCTPRNHRAFVKILALTHSAVTSGKAHKKANYKGLRKERQVVPSTLSRLLAVKQRQARVPGNLTQTPEAKESWRNEELKHISSDSRECIIASENCGSAWVPSVQVCVRKSKHFHRNSNNPYSFMGKLNQSNTSWKDERNQSCILHIHTPSLHTEMCWCVDHELRCPSLLHHSNLLQQAEGPVRRKVEKLAGWQQLQPRVGHRTWRSILLKRVDNSHLR